MTEWVEQNSLWRSSSDQSLHREGQHCLSHLNPNINSCCGWKWPFFSQLLTENCCTSGICHTLQQQKLFSDAKMNIRGLKVCLSWLQLHVGSPKGAYLSFPQILRTAPISSSSFPTETDGCPCDFCSWSSSLEIKQTRLFYTLKLMFSWELTQLGLFSL